MSNFKKIITLTILTISLVFANSSSSDIPSGSSNDCWDNLKGKTICMSVNFKTHECYGENYKYILGNYFNIVSKRQWNYDICESKANEWLKQNQLNDEELACMMSVCKKTFNTTDGSKVSF